MRTRRILTASIAVLSLLNSASAIAPAFADSIVATADSTTVAAAQDGSTSIDSSGGLGKKLNVASAVSIASTIFVGTQRNFSSRVDRRVIPRGFAFLRLI